MSDSSGSDHENFGIETRSAARLRSLCATTPGLRALYVFGSRARGDHHERSDIDFEADAPGWTRREHFAFVDALIHAPTVYSIDCVWRQSALPEDLRERIARDRRVFWQHPEAAGHTTGSAHPPGGVIAATSAGPQLPGS